MNESPPPLPERSRFSKRAAAGFLIVLVVLAVAAGLAIGRWGGHGRVVMVEVAMPGLTPAPGVAPTPAANEGGGTVGEQALELLPVTSEEEPGESSIERFLLHIPIKTRSTEPIDVKGVVIHVLFYDLVGGAQVVQTRADVNSRWATPPADWNKTDTEELDVEYDLRKPKDPPTTEGENRKYYGYIVRVYYHGKLQGATAVPDRLRQQYPAPATLPKEAASSAPPAGAVAGAEQAAGPTKKMDKSTAIDGVATGATLDIFPVKVDTKPDDQLSKHLLLHIPIKARHGAQIDVKSVVVQVLFYDVIDGKAVVPTHAAVESRWATPPADWVSTDVEDLDVDYQLAKPDAEEATPQEERKYFGYLVRVYYQGKLQAVTADPERLMHQYPAPETLPEAAAPARATPTGSGAGDASTPTEAPGTEKDKCG